MFVVFLILLYSYVFNFIYLSRCMYFLCYYKCELISFVFLKHCDKLSKKDK